VAKLEGKFKRGDVIYPIREGTADPLPSKVVLQRSGINYELCSYSDPELKAEGLGAKYLAKSRMPVTKVEAEYALYTKDSLRECEEESKGE